MKHAIRKWIIPTGKPCSVIAGFLHRWLGFPQGTAWLPTSIKPCAVLSPLTLQVGTAFCCGLAQDCSCTMLADWPAVLCQSWGSSSVLLRTGVSTVLCAPNGYLRLKQAVHGNRPPPHTHTQTLCAWSPEYQHSRGNCSQAKGGELG